MTRPGPWRLWKAKRLQKFTETWYQGLLEASEEAAKSPATEGGEKKYSEQDKEEILHLKEQIKASQEELNKMEPVGTVSAPASIDPFNTKEMVKWAQKILNAFKNVAVPSFGDVRIEAKRIDQSFNYLPSDKNKTRQAAQRRAMIAAYPMIPRVLKQGLRIQDHTRHKGNQHDTVTFAAPVVIDGVRGNMAVVVTITNDNYYIVHRVLTKDGDLLMIGEKKEADSQPAGLPSNEEQIVPHMHTASENSIRASKEKSKTESKEKEAKHQDRETDWPDLTTEEQEAEINATMSTTKFQEREDLPEDRELLMAAKAEGKNAEILTAY